MSQYTMITPLCVVQKVQKDNFLCFGNEQIDYKYQH